MDSEPRPRSAPHSSQPQPQPRSAARKVFNCIVDDTALVAGVKRSTRNGLRQWVKNGQIRLFVPLHALEQLSTQKNAATRHGEDVRETLEWLDQATTKHPDAIALQGGDDIFASWHQVEQFAVPRSLFSEYDANQLDYVTGESASESSPILTKSEAATTTTATTTTKTHPREVSTQSQRRVSRSVQLDDKVQDSLRPLFNYILWRIHQEEDPVAALESFIFLCNDPQKAHLAKGFEVRCKRLEQLRDTVSREDRETRKQDEPQHRSTQSVGAVNLAHQSSQDFIEPTTPPTVHAVLTGPVVDPDTFSRVPLSPRIPISPARGSYDQARRGRGSVRGRGAQTAAKGRGSPRVISVDSEIDPNSFTRPRDDNSGRGGRKLWMPS